MVAPTKTRFATGVPAALAAGTRTVSRIFAHTLLAALCVGWVGCAQQTWKARNVMPPTDIWSGQKPLWASAEDITRYCDGALKRAEAAREAVAASHTAAGLETTLRPYNTLLTVLDAAQGWASLMFSVHPEESCRTAAQTCQQRLSAFATNASLDRRLYDAVAKVDLSGLDAGAKRFTALVLRDFRRSGVDKDETIRNRVKAIRARLVELGQSFKKHVQDDVREITVDGPEALRGLPADWIASHPPGKDGKIRITTDYPDFLPLQSYGEDAGLRRALYLAFMQRGYPDNGPTLMEILRLRHEFATTLGYPSWAAYVAEDKMVKSAEAIDAFIRKLVTIVRPRSEADLKALLARKQKDDPKATVVDVWDRFFYAAKVQTEQYGFDAREARPYFTYPRVKDGVLSLYSELFGVQFARLEREPVWHPDVEAWVMRSNGEEIGRFYLDMFPRKGKYKHAAMNGSVTGLAGGQMPIGTLMCNFPNPHEGKALMEHSQVVTFFHEFGHLIHHLLARNSAWVNQAGINVEWDFVEVPSQILEEWAWDPAVLARFAHHVDTGAPIPADMVRKMRASDEFGKGAGVMRQLFYTAYSFYLHARDPKDVDLEAFSAEMYREYSPFPAVPGGHVYANFGHLIGYSSMYYTYQWSLVIAKDLFGRFREAGLLNRDVAQRYRKTILEPGGTRDAADLVHEFLGRPYSLEAYEAWLRQ